jgi:hypothetical protein
VGVNGEVEKWWRLRRIGVGKSFGKMDIFRVIIIGIGFCGSCKGWNE